MTSMLIGVADPEVVEPADDIAGQFVNDVLYPVSPIAGKPMPAAFEFLVQFRSQSTA